MNASAKQPECIHLWFPGCNPSDGGIQTYSYFIARAMQEIFPRTRLEILSKNDFGAPPYKLGDEVRFHHTGRLPRRLRTLAFSAQALRMLRSSPPELILSTLVNFAPLALTLTKRRPVPYWLVAHGVDVWGRTDPGFLQSLRGAERILCVSRYTRDRLISEQSIDPARLVLQPNTFDQDKFRLAEKPSYLLQRHNIAVDQPVLLTVARLSRAEGYKGYDRVLEALVHVRTQVPNVKYLLIGKGDDAERVRAMIAANQLEDHVILTGFVNEKELPDYYNLCDLFVMPSKGEGFGIVFLEALASGKPVIAGNSDGSVDPLMDGELGVLIDPDDAASLAGEIVAILTKTHAKGILYQPEVLRQKAISSFGNEVFKQKLQHQFMQS